MKNFKIDNSYIFTTENKIEIYIPDNLKNIKVVEAILNVKIKNVTLENSSFQVNFESIKDSDNNKKWNYVDYLKNIKSEDILKINISDELQTVIDSEATTLVLHFKCNTSNITFDTSSIGFINIDYISLEEFQNNGNTHEINLNKSGTAKINLSTGKLNINTPLISSDENVLPISINAKYNSVKNNKLPNIGLPDHWSLNVNQFLIKNETKDDKISFTYIDDNGKNQIIEEKFYYIDDNGNKTSIKKDKITVDLDGNLKYNDKNVETKLEAPSGIKLVSSIKDFKGSNLVDYEPEELVNIKNQIKQIESQIEILNSNYESANLQIALLVLTKSLIEKQTDYKNNNLEQNEKYNNLLKYIESSNYKIKNKRSFKEIDSEGSTSTEMEYAKEYLGENYFSYKQISDIYNYYKNNTAITLPSDQSKELQLSDVKVISSILRDESSFITNLGTIEPFSESNDKVNISNEFVGSIALEKNGIEFEKKLAEPITNQEFSNNIKNEIESFLPENIKLKIVSNDNNQESEESSNAESQTEYVLDLDKISKEFYNSNTLSLSMKDLITTNIQIKSLIDNNIIYNKQLKEYNDNLIKLNHQKDQYEMQVPVHYLYNDDNIIYGFGKTNNENTFRLVLITDIYENYIYIRYESLDSNKIQNIIDTADKSITFTYKYNLLSTITDARNRQVKFVYNNNKDLHSIIHVDKTKTFYYYLPQNNIENEISDKKLIAVLNQTGLGTLFDYTDNKISKATSLSILNDVTNGKISYKKLENGIITIQNSFDFDSLEASTLQNCEEYKIKNDSTTFDYKNYKTTTLTNSKNKNITYIFDKEGIVRTIYENGFNENNTNDNEINFRAKDFSYQDSNLNMTISPLPYSQNYLDDVAFKENEKSIEYGYYLGESDSVCCDTTIPFSYSINAKYYTISENDNEKKSTVSMTNHKLELLNEELPNDSSKEEICLHRTFVVSGWAKAENASFTLTDEDNKESYPEYINNRKFEIRVIVKYKQDTENSEDIETFTRPFDWRNTEWQYCAVDITLKNKSVESIECIVDFSENTGNLIFTDLDFRQADFEITEYDSIKRPIRNYSAHNNYITSYEYEDEETTNPCKQVITNKFNENEVYTTTYEYTKEGKQLRSIDYNGIVTENVYNKQGALTKTITYHKDEPTNKFYNEKKLDDNGKETSIVNELGEETMKYEYIDGTGIVSASIDEKGIKTSYGYDSADTLTETSITANGIENTNTYGYNLDFLTSLKHNDIEIGYDYDGEGRTKQINIAKNMYLSKEYGDNEETTLLKSNESYRQTFNDNGDVVETFYKTKEDLEESKIVENVYDTYGNLTISKDLIENNTHTYFYDKFGNTIKETNTQHGKDISIENELDTSHSNINKSTIKIGDETFDYEYYRDETPDAILKAITLPNGIEQTISYDKLNRVNEIQVLDFNKHFYFLKNGDHASNFISKLQFSINGVNKDNLTYKYDKQGNITEIRENNLLLSRYQYDSLSRISREDNAKLNKTHLYFYDAGGNISQKIEYNYTLVENLDFENPTNSFSYSYPTNGWKDQLIKFNGESFEYDELGNPKIYRDKTLVWSHGRQLDKFANIAEYKYNAKGIRTSKITNGFTTNYFLNGNKILRQQDATNSITFYYAADGVTGFYLKNNVVDDYYYYKKNAQNDIIGIYSTNGEEIAHYDYDAWGNCVVKYLQDDGTYAIINDDYSFNDTTIINRFIAFKNPFRYRSYYYDFETNLYYLNSRYYDPQIGRFINADDITTLDVTQVALNGLNLYAYCLNNPVNEIDENGYFLSFLIGLFIAAAIGAAVGAVSYTASVVIKGITTGKWEWNWAEFLGSVVGGFIGGAFAIIPFGGSYISAFMTGVFTNIFTDAFSHWIYGTEFNFGDSLLKGVFSGTISMIFVGVIDFKYSIKGINFGRGSWNAITKQIYTKFRRDIIKKISWSTFGKMFGNSLYGSILDILHSGLIN